MKSCPCCSGQLVRHIRHQQQHSQVCWFCRRCWQDMPDSDWTNYSIQSSILPRPTLSHQQMQQRERV